MMLQASENSIGTQKSRPHWFRFSVRTLFVLVTLSGIALAGLFWFLAAPRYDAHLLAPNAMRTNAPSAVLGTAIHMVHEELRLRHFRDATGKITFGDRTSRDTTFQQSARQHGDFGVGYTAFDDPSGNRVTIRTYNEPGIGTLIVWEYAGGQDVQKISVILQKELAVQGVRILAD